MNEDQRVKKSESAGVPYKKGGTRGKAPEPEI